MMGPHVERRPDPGSLKQPILRWLSMHQVFRITYDSSATTALLAKSIPWFRHTNCSVQGSPTDMEVTASYTHV